MTCIPHPSYKTFAWIPAAAESKYENRSIQKIHAICHPAGPIDITHPSSPKTNHWSLCLQLTSSCPPSTTTSILLDPIPAGPQGTLICALSIIQDQDDIPSNPPLPSVPLTPSPDLSVKGFIGLLKEHKLDEYRFTETGQGCRYWICSVAQLLDRTLHLGGRGGGDDHHDPRAVELDGFLVKLGLTWGDDGSALDGELGTGVVPGTFLGEGSR